MIILGDLNEYFDFRCSLNFRKNELKNINASEILK